MRMSIPPYEGSTREEGGSWCTDFCPAPCNQSSSTILSSQHCHHGRHLEGCAHTCPNTSPATAIRQVLLHANVAFGLACQIPVKPIQNCVVPPPMTAIPNFSNTRLFDSSVQGRPLTLSEWPHVLWRHYTADDDATLLAGRNIGRARFRKQAKMTLHRPFAATASIPSYTSSAQPIYPNALVTETAARANRSIRQRVVSNAHETEWRCELLSLGALMLNSYTWPVLRKSVQDRNVSCMRAEGTSGIDIMPDEEDLLLRSRSIPRRKDWQTDIAHLQCSMQLLDRWPDCPRTSDLFPKRLQASTKDDTRVSWRPPWTFAFTHPSRTWPVSHRSRSH